MSITVLQEKIRKKKTPLALVLSPAADRIPAGILRRFTEMYGPGPMAEAEALRYWGAQLLEQTAEKLPAAVLQAECYLRYGPMGLDVLINLVQMAKEAGLYTIVDAKACEPELWVGASVQADGVTVVPYMGGDCCSAAEDKSVFALLRSANPSSGDVQNLMAGDRRLYVAVGEQMARRGAAAVIETGYSLDIRELRRRLDKTFLLLRFCDAENALPAFDDYGHGALAADEQLQYAEDPAAAAEEAVRSWKRWVTVV